MKILKKNQLAILVIALMLVTAGYLNYTAGNTAVSTGANVIGEAQYAAIGDATLVNSGELIEENDKQNIINTIANAQSNIIQDTSSISKGTKQDKENTTLQTSAKTDDYFDNSKLERDKMYSQMIETYQGMLESSTVSAEQKSISTQEITNINNKLIFSIIFFNSSSSLLTNLLLDSLKNSRL